MKQRHTPPGHRDHDDWRDTTLRRVRDRTGRKPSDGELVLCDGTLVTLDQAVEHHRHTLAAVDNPPEPVGAVIEVVERRPRPTGDDDWGDHLVAPNDIRINGQSLLAPAGYPVQVHEIVASGGDVVYCTLTLIARRVFIGHAYTDESADDHARECPACIAVAQKRTESAEASP